MSSTDQRVRSTAKGLLNILTSPLHFFIAYSTPIVSTHRIKVQINNMAVLAWKYDEVLGICSSHADTLLDNLTVYEQLLYTSELKNSQKESLPRKRARVDLVLTQLSMESCKNVTIGSAMKRGISGEVSPKPMLML